MAAQVKSPSVSKVALLGREDPVRAQLRAALVDAGAEVAIECDLASLDISNLRASNAATVIVNLDPGSEDALEQLDELIADEHVRVVFNESETTGQLSGWDLARWARHLVAKVVGHGDSTPPPPPGAELLPLRDLSIEPGAPFRPAQQESELDMGRFSAEAEASSGEVPSSPRIKSTVDPLAESEIVEVELEHDEPDPSVATLDVGIIEREPMHDAPEADETPLEVSVVRPGDDGSLDRFSLDMGEIEGALAGIEAGSKPGLADASAELQRQRPRRLGPDEPTVVLSRDDLRQAMERGDGAAHGKTASLAGASENVEAPRRLGPDEPTVELKIDALSRESASGQELPRRLGPDEPTTVLDVGELQAELEEMADELGDESAADSLGDGLSLEETSIDLSGDMESGLDSGLDLEASVEELSAELGEGDSFSLELEGNDIQPLPSADFEEGELSLDDDVAKLSAQFDALAAHDGETLSSDDEFAYNEQSIEGDSNGGFDLSLSEDLADESAAAETASSTSESQPESAGREASAGFGELSLLDLDDETASAPAAASQSKSEFDFSGLNLSLEPLDGEAEQGEQPTQASAAVAAPDAAPLKASAGITRVVVLAASIGGPDAVRTFLSGIPKNFPALFLLSQHLESGFFGRLSQQLQKVTSLDVRVAERGAEPVSNGEVIVVPSGSVFSFAQDGRIESFAYSEPPRYKPCIDDLLREVAQQFGTKVTAIVFSGMAGDAVEGAAEVTRKGGEVWAQSPASCVVSSMVDGALARGVVEFVGTPRELAERMVQKYLAG